MAASKDQVKAKSGRPTKNGQSAATGADRSRAYRERKRAAASDIRTESERMMEVMARLVVAFYEGGELNLRVARVLQDHAYSVKYIKQALKSGVRVAVNRPGLMSILNQIEKDSERKDEY